MTHLSQVNYITIPSLYNSGVRAPRNYVRDSLRLAFPPGAKRRIACMLAAYFDESGTHGRDSKTVVVAGYLADSDRWLRFNDAWQVALKDYGISYFHMKDFVADHKKYRWGKKKASRFSRLHTLTRRAVYFGMAVVLDLDAWKSHVVTPKDHRYFGTSHYDFCATGIMGLVAKWANDTGVDEGISYTFERGACGWKQFQQTYDKAYDDPRLRKAYRMLGGLELKDKRLYPPLQPADIAAYALYKGRAHVDNRVQLGWNVPYLEGLSQVPVGLCLVDDGMLRAMKKHKAYINAK